MKYVNWSGFLAGLYAEGVSPEWHGSRPFCRAACSQFRDGRCVLWGIEKRPVTEWSDCGPALELLEDWTDFIDTGGA